MCRRLFFKFVFKFLIITSKVFTKEQTHITLSEIFHSDVFNKFHGIDVSILLWWYFQLYCSRMQAWLSKFRRTLHTLGANPKKGRDHSYMYVCMPSHMPDLQCLQGIPLPSKLNLIWFCSLKLTKGARCKLINPVFRFALGPWKQGRNGKRKGGVRNWDVCHAPRYAYNYSIKKCMAGAINIIFEQQQRKQSSKFFALLARCV